MPRILVADDNTNIQKMVALALEERGIDVVSVGNGEAAVRRIPDLSPDLVLADVFMPVRNGYEVCEFVKKDERFSHVPVILLVGAFDPLDEKEARRVGADGVLKKPFVPPDPLIAMVTSALEKNPKFVAEMSKVRETAPPPPPPAVLEAPARIQPKPLPDFPEPTPEEAALIYGFGKGRGADRDDASPKPLAPTDQGEEQDELDAAMTVSDWRRSAANFEVPAELGDKPAFAADEDFHHEMFPSERDVPPKHIRVADEEEKIPALAADEPIAQVDLEQKLVEEEQAGEMVQAAEPEQIQVAEKPLAKAPETPSQPAPAAPAKQSVPARTSQPGDWMDAGTPAASEYENGGWMSKVFGSAGRASSPPKQDAADRSDPVTTPSAKSNESPAQKEQASTKQEEASSVPSKTAAESWFAPPPPPVLKPPVENHPLGSAPQQTDNRSFAVGSDALLEPDDSARRSGAYASSEPVPLSSDVEIPQGPFSAAESNKASAEKTDGNAAPRGEDSPVFAPTEASTGANGSSERIPTTPPPNREALAEIPFLTPPPPSPLEVKSSRDQDSPSVDTVVAKVLEKLEPQLHDLLKQSVLKPLVENLLQNEDAKKEK